MIRSRVCCVCVCVCLRSWLLCRAHEVGLKKRKVENVRRLTWSAMVISGSPLYGTTAVRFRSSELAADPASRSQRRHAGAHKGDAPGVIERDVILSRSGA